MERKPPTIRIAKETTAAFVVCREDSTPITSTIALTPARSIKKLFKNEGIKLAPPYTLWQCTLSLDETHPILDPEEIPSPSDTEADYDDDLDEQ